MAKKTVYKPALNAHAAYMLESEEEVGGEPRPLSVLLPVVWGASPAAAVIDMIRSSSGEKANVATVAQSQTDDSIAANLQWYFDTTPHIRSHSYRDQDAAGFKMP